MTRFNTLRIRLVLWTMAINTVLLAMLGSAGWIVLQRGQEQALNETLKLSAAQLIAAVDVTNGRFTVPAGDAAALTERGVYGWVVDGAGQVNTIPGQTVSVHIADVNLGQLSEQQLASGERIRLLRRPLAETNGSVIVGKSLEPLQQNTRTILLALIIATPLVLALSAIGGLFLAGRALSPIATITAQARQISQDNLTERLALVGPRDEVRELARTFDAMLDRLQTAFEIEQRFTADASHELRTPLSLLQAQISLALSQPRDVPTLTQMMKEMHGDIHRMRRLVESMLSLARTGEPLNQHVSVDVAAVLGSLTGQMQAASATRRIQFALDAPPALRAKVMGDPDRLMQLFMNLIDNALKYSPDGGSVRIGVRPQATGWVVEVADDGIGIAPEHLAHVFDRFYRSDPSRARETGGIGLGLSIAQAIAKQHGGHITVRSVLGTGSVFTVWLPKSE